MIKINNTIEKQLLNKKTQIPNLYFYFQMNSKLTYLI